MIRLNVFIRTLDENRDDVVRIAKELVAASLCDDGCVAYDLFESATRDNVMMICETWSDEAALEKHSAAEHFTILVPQLESLSEMKLERFEF